MSPVQFLIVSIFIVVCIYVTYSTQRKYIGLLKQRDALIVALKKLIEQIGDYYPEGLHPEGKEVASAKKILIDVVRGKIPKK